MSPSDFKKFRKDLHLTQEKLAHMMQVSHSTVSKWEQGRVGIPGPARVLIKLFWNTGRHRLVVKRRPPAA